MKRTIVRIISAVVGALLALALASTDRGVRIPLSIVLGLSSFVLMVLSRRQLGEAFAVTAKAKALVTTGLYSRIQHPLYLFLDLFLLCIIAAIDLPVLLLAWAVLVIIQAIQSRREEEVLSAAFGAEYEVYSDRTWI